MSKSGSATSAIKSEAEWSLLANTISEADSHLPAQEPASNARFPIVQSWPTRMTTGYSQFDMTSGGRTSLPSLEESQLRAVSRASDPRTSHRFDKRHTFGRKLELNLSSAIETLCLGRWQLRSLPNYVKLLPRGIFGRAEPAPGGIR